jgi:hypothetical protein
MLEPGWDEADLMAAQPVIQQYLQATTWNGPAPWFAVRWDTTGLLNAETPLPFQPNAHLRLAVPAEARRFAQRYQHDGPTICILPVSTAGLAQSPSPQAWAKICAAFAAAIPNVQMFITGITYVDELGRRWGFDFSPEDAHRISAQVPGVVECFDIGMWNQIALIEQCDLFCSPHTGFAFVAQFVGTPWLTISSCPWREYLFNGVPFYSALPDCPCMQHWHTETQPDCIADEAVRQRLPDIVAGAQLLLPGTLTFAEACQLHIDKLKAAGRTPAHFPYFDWTK